MRVVVVVKFFILWFLCNLWLPAQAVSLKDAVNQAVQSNPNMLVQMQGVNQAKTQVWSSAADFFPKIELNSSYGREDSLNFSTNFQWTSLPPHVVALYVTQNVFKGAKTIYDLEQNKANLSASRSLLKATSEELAFNVAQTYLKTLRDSKLLKLTASNVEIHKKNFRIIRLRAEKGAASRAEAELAEGRLHVAMVRYAQQVKDYEDDLSTYIKLVGSPPVELKTPHIASHYLKLSLPKLIALVKKWNPQVSKAGYDVTKSLNAHKANRSEFMPSVDVVLTRYRGENVGGIEGPEYNTSAVVKLSWNLFNGGGSISKLMESSYRHVQAIDQLSNVQRNAVESVRLAYNKTVFAKSTIPLYKRYSQTSKFVVGAYRLQYVAGKRTLIDVLNVEDEAFFARKGYISAEFEFYEAECAILKELGILVTTLNNKEPDHHIS